MKHRISIFLFFLALTACNKQEEQVKPKVPPEDYNIEIGRNIVSEHSEEGQLKIRIKAPLLKRHSSKKAFSEFPEGLEIELFDEQGQLESKLTAGNGQLFDHSEELSVSDSVTVVNRKGETLECEMLLWNQKTGNLKSDGFVKITTEDEIVYGSGLEATKGFEQYTIKNVSGTIKLKQDEVDADL